MSDEQMSKFPTLYTANVEISISRDHNSVIVATREGHHLEYYIYSYSVEISISRDHSSVIGATREGHHLEYIYSQGWEFAHLFSERIARFCLKMNE